jgi:general secretion pathway protein A
MYRQFYKLKEEPFKLTPDPKFLYLSRSHEKALTLLLHGVRNREGFIVGIKDLFKFVCFDLGIQTKAKTKGDVLLQIYQFLVESYNENKNVVVIIDEAHNLNSVLLEEIRLLSNFEATKGKLIQIILVGQPELSFTLNSSKCRPLRQRIRLWFYLNPLNRQETGGYIRSRLYEAGLEARCFTEKAISEIFRYSKGIPRLINILCDRSLTVGYVKDEKRINEKIVKEAIVDLEAFENPVTNVNDKTTITNQRWPSS